MSCFNACGCSPALFIGSVGEDKKKRVLQDLLKRLKERGANVNADILFTFFWTGHTDLDMWVFHEESGAFTSYRKKTDGIQGLTLDVDANASDSNLIDNPIENIGILNANNGPDGTYSVYLDNYKNRNTGGNFFNYVTMYKPDPDSQFRKVMWYKNTTSFDAGRGDGDKSKMLHVLTLKKTGRVMEVIQTHPDMVVEFTN